jgi:hypothetical protein
MVVDQVQKMMAAALSPLSRTKAPDIASEGKEQISRAAQDLVEWSMRSRERMTGLVRAEVRSQLKQLGVASRDEVEALRKRVRELEKSSSPKRRTTRKTTRTRRSTTTKTPAPSPAPTTRDVEVEVDVVEIPLVEPEVDVVVATELTSIPVDGPIPEAEGPGTLPS